MNLLIKLTAGLGIAMATGGTGIASAFELVGTKAAMINAGFVTLCGDAAVCLIENGGDPARAIKAMGRNGTALTVARAMATAGLVDKVSGMAGVKSGLEPDAAGKVIPREFTDYAAKAAISSAVNTVMSVAIDGQDFRQAMLQGMTSAALNTVASYGAGQIGGLYSKEAVNYGMHKALHGLTGAGLGVGLAAISHTDPRLGAASGAFGAVMSEMIAEGFKPEMADVERYAKEHPGTKPEEVRAHFLAKAQTTANWSAFASAVGAFGIGMDPSFAHSSAHNAVDNNFLQYTPQGIFTMVAIATAVEYPQFIRDLETDQAHVALGKMGIRVVEGTLVGLGVGCAFQVGGKIGGVACKTLQEAFAAAIARNPALQSVYLAVESRLDRITAYVKDQFNYRQHFAAERAREAAAKVGGKTVPESAPKKSVRFAEVEGVKAKTSEQPWTVRDGQEWKEKIFGQAQVTGGKDTVAGQAHAIRSYREAINAAKREDVSAVFLNRGIRKATDHPIPKPNTRPDVTIRRADGKIDQVEVPSRTDDLDLLRARMAATESRLPASMQGGKKDLIGFTTEVPQ